MTDTPAELRARFAALPKPALWLIAARLKTLSLSQVPVFAGVWLAGDGVRLDVMIMVMISAAAIQVGTNLWNDAADAARGIDGPDRLGPPRMTALGLLDGASVRSAAAASFGLAALAGVWLTMIGGWPVVAIGLASLALGYFYSMGPRPLSGLPFGEILVIGFFGIVAVSGSGWLMGADPFAARSLMTGVMVGLPAAAVLMLNNHRDRAQDARAGRRTLAIVIGPNASRLFHFACLLGALGFGAVLNPTGWLAVPTVLALWLGHAIRHWPISPRLNRLLGPTAAFQALLLGVVSLG